MKIRPAILIPGAALLLVTVYLGLAKKSARSPGSTPPAMCAAEPASAGEPELLSAEPASQLAHSPGAEISVEMKQTPPLPHFEPSDEYEKLLARFNPRLMNNAAVEDFLRQRLWLALDQLNNPLIASMNLSPEQTGQLKNLIVDTLVAATDQVAGSADESAADIENQLQHLLAMGLANFDQRARYILGESQFAVYDTHKAEYAQFNRIKFLAGSAPFSDAETESILGLMANERKRVTATAIQLQNADIASGQNVSPEQMARESEEIQKLIDERIVEQLRPAFSAQQLAAFQRLQGRPLELSLGLAPR